MPTLRHVHLQIGCLVVPMTLFFAVSGAWQIYDFHRAQKDGSYRPPHVLVVLSDLHQNKFFRVKKSAEEACAEIASAGENQTCREEWNEHVRSTRMRSTIYSAVILLGAVGLVVNGVTGICLALRTPVLRRSAIALLTLGLIIPLVVTIL